MLDTSGLNKRITVVCGTMICTNFVCTTNGALAAHQGIVYCERCRQDRKRQIDAEYHEKNREKRNARKRVAPKKVVPKTEQSKIKGRRSRRGRKPKLTNAQVEAIRERLDNDKSWGVGMALAREYGVSPTHIYDIGSRKKRANAC